MKKIFYTLLLGSLCSGAANAQTVLYGLARGTEGSIIKYDPADASTGIQKASTLSGLPWYNDLIEHNGYLYGMTESGGNHGLGTIFRYKPGTTISETLFSFNGTNGASPYGSLVVDAATGTFYGMTQSGGANNFGTIFSFKDGDAAVTPLHSFDKTNGRAPHGSLLLYGGKLYGMTESGGLNGSGELNDYGTIFSINLNGSGFTVLHNFNITNGRSPYGSLVAAGGRLYGMTQFGGGSGYGVLFSIEPDGTDYRKVDFNWTNGAWPNSTLTLLDDGKLYGTTESGGTNNYGAIFSFTPSTSTPGTGTITPLHSFSEADGRSPYGSLLEVENGGSSILYGTTFRGGAEDKGVLFSITPSGSYTKLDDFTGTTSINPAASLVAVNNTALPVTISSFTAHGQNGKVQLAWEVHSESEIDKYEVERSTDGITFRSVDFVAAANRSARHTYTYTDAQPEAGNNYYRLKIHERHRAAHYSPTRMVQIALATLEATVQPNPVSAATRLHLRLAATGRVQMQLYNAQGVSVRQWPATTYAKGAHYLPLQLGNLPAGTYVLVIEAAGQRQTLQLVSTGNR